MRRPGNGSRPGPRKGRSVSPDIDRIFEDGTAVDRAFDRAVRDALRMHKRAGNPIAIWKDGKVVWISASKIRP